MTTEKGNTPALLLGALRAVGGATVLAPAVGARTLGIEDDAEGTYLVRLFAARNLALAGGCWRAGGTRGGCGSRRASPATPSTSRPGCSATARGRSVPPR
ncbi:hypothetical protein GXW82_29315 [Streptacidiphilus sp. 4-A2]|nr:hypothetical protein [Streptacidiphilus sp. 4-A2]